MENKTKQTINIRQIHFEMRIRLETMSQFLKNTILNFKFDTDFRQKLLLP